jgi:ABC-type branched-subunit amino acid transport system substrate-binding protein
MKKLLKIFFYSFLAIMVMVSFFIWPIIQNLLQEEEQPIRVAFIGPMSGEGKAAGQLMSQAIKLYFEEENNKKGKINGKRIELEIFDDQNDCFRDKPKTADKSKTGDKPKTDDKPKAEEEALNILRYNRFIAVIGHWHSDCSITGGKIYKKYGIPAITSGSVKKEVTYDNNWYFRNIYNASTSAQFLAYYVNKVFGLNQVSIIYDNTGYGAYLASEFKKYVTQLGMEITINRKFSKDENMNLDIEDIVSQLEENAQEAGAILLATQATEGVQLVKLIKDRNIKNHIISGSEFSEQAFKDGFDKFSKEKAYPGYYTNNIYVATPLIFDIANEKLQQFREKYQAAYYEEPDWSAAYAYDTAMVLVKAIKQAEIIGTQKSIVTDRQKIRKTLASFTNIDEAVEGATGFNYFDDQRDAQKPVTIGVYKNKELVFALTQFQVMRNRHEVPDWNKAQEQGRVLEIGDNRYYKTNFVYTGVKIKEISELDINNLTYKLDFYLWFRFQGKFDSHNIEFLNAAKPIILGEPIAEKFGYRLYHIKGHFKADFVPNDDTSKQHVLGIKFRHNRLNQKNLIYITDVRGMGSNNQQFSLEIWKKTQVLMPTTGWFIKRVLFFIDRVKEPSLGDPDYLWIRGGMLEYSQFNMGIWVDKIKKLELTTVLKMWLIHLAFWIVLIFVYPYFPQIQAIFFWNPYVRRIMGLGYVNFALTWVPYLRRKLLKPFQPSLLADAALSNFGKEAYFENAEVKHKGSPKTLPIKKAIPKIKGQIILEGESGLGKTMALRYLLTASKKRLVVFLPADKCTKGIIPAIQAKLHGMAKDEMFLQNLIYSGAIDICIDGLNQVSADTRAKITEFVESYFKGHIIMTTQPIEWNPPTNAEFYVLQPLKPDQIEAFIVSRYDILPEDSTLSYFEYEQKCQGYLANTLRKDQPSEVLESIRRTLSNPMELTIIAQMLAHGQTPDFFNLQEQQYEMVAADFERTHINRQFRLIELSEHVYQMRVDDEASLPKKKFFDEIKSMEKYRMVVSRQSEDADGHPVKEWYFRHDKIMEFFLVKTFYNESHYRKQRTVNHFHDPRFRGIYFRLAMCLPLKEAIVLRDKLMEYATKSGDHSVFDTFVQILSSREKTLSED